MLNYDKSIKLPRRLKKTVAYFQEDLAKTVKSGNLDEAVHGVVDQLNASRSFFLGTGHERRQNRLPELAKFHATKPYPKDVGKSQKSPEVTESKNKVNKDIVKVMPESCCKFIMCEYNKGEYNPKLVVLFYASDIFRSKLQGRDDKLRKPWMRDFAPKHAVLPVFKEEQPAKEPRARSPLRKQRSNLDGVIESLKGVLNVKTADDGACENLVFEACRQTSSSSSNSFLLGG